MTTGRRPAEVREKISKALRGVPRPDLRGVPRSDEVKQKISKASIGRKKGPRGPMTDEHRENISKALAGRGKGVPLSNEHRESISEALRGRVKGPLPDEVKQKISAALRGRERESTKRGKISRDRSRPVLVNCITDQEIKKYRSHCDLSRKLKFCRGTIRRYVDSQKVYTSKLTKKQYLIFSEGGWVIEGRKFSEEIERRKADEPSSSIFNSSVYKESHPVIVNCITDQEINKYRSYRDARKNLNFCIRTINKYVDSKKIYTSKLTKKQYLIFSEGKWEIEGRIFSEEIERRKADESSSSIFKNSNYRVSRPVIVNCITDQEIKIYRSHCDLSKNLKLGRGTIRKYVDSKKIYTSKLTKKEYLIYSEGKGDIGDNVRGEREEDES